MWRIFNQLTVLLMLLLPSVHAAETEHAHGVHGMVLFSNGRELFASHLPLLRPPHDYQVVLRLKAINDLQHNELLQAAEHNRLTIEPEHFDLLMLRDGRLSAFNATVYDGHFERAGRRRGSSGFKVENVALFESVTPCDQSLLRYYIIKHSTGSYMVRRLCNAGDVDHILHTSRSFLAEFIEQPLPLTVPSRDPELPDLSTVWWETADFASP